jgi:hypothetical protein
MDKLIEIGFKNVGYWKLENEIFLYEINSNLSNSNLIYSFVCENEIFYIGKTTDTLKNRMNGYKNANSTQKTNIRVKGEILTKLKENKKVDVFILIDRVNLEYKGYKICLASGLEDNLIKVIQPKWNFRGKIRIKEQEVSNKNDNIIFESIQPTENILRTVEIKLGNEYWSKGFFNFSKKELELLPNEPTEVIISLGENDEFHITGHFHFPDKSKQPRVRGNIALKQWFQDNFELNQNIKVDILNRNLFRIKK